MPGWVFAGNPPPEINYLYSTSVNKDVLSFSVPLGEARDDRYIVVGVGGDQRSVSVNGIALTPLAGNPGILWGGVVPTGTTGTVVIQANGSSITLFVWSITGLLSFTPTDTGLNVSTSSGSFPLSCQELGVRVVMARCYRATGNVSLGGVTRDAIQNTNPPSGTTIVKTAGGRAVNTATGNVTISASVGGAGTGTNLLVVGASFR